MRHLQKTGVREPPERGGPHVGRVPVPGQCRPPEDPHRHDDHHIQENLRQPRHTVEVSLGVLWDSLGSKTECIRCIIHSVSVSKTHKRDHYEL